MPPGPAEPARRRKPADPWVARPMLYTAGMKDLVFVCATFAFFALGWLYVRALDRL
jgi:hypothetical protein